MSQEYTKIPEDWGPEEWSLVFGFIGAVMITAIVWYTTLHEGKEKDKKVKRWLEVVARRQDEYDGAHGIKRDDNGNIIKG